MEVIKITVSKAAQRATEKYAKENYDRILVKFPKGTISHDAINWD